MYFPNLIKAFKRNIRISFIRSNPESVVFEYLHKIVYFSNQNAQSNAIELTEILEYKFDIIYIDWPIITKYNTFTKPVRPIHYLEDQKNLHLLQPQLEKLFIFGNCENYTNIEWLNILNLCINTRHINATVFILNTGNTSLFPSIKRLSIPYIGIE